MKCYSGMDEIDYILGVKESSNESLINTGLTKQNAIKVPENSDNLIRLSYRYLKNNLYTKKLINKKEFDIFHPTFSFPGLSKNLKGKPFVVTIMDMIPELFPEMYPENSFYSKYITNIL